MQINIKNVSYKNINNINFDIEKNKITGIVSNNVDELNDLSDVIYENKKDEGIIKYSPAYNKRKIGLISSKQIYNMINGNVYEFFLLKSRKLQYDIKKLDDKLKIVGLSNSILKKDLSILSTSEKIKVLFANILLHDPDLILLDNIFPQLDYKSRDIFYKILIELKLKRKTIVICSIDIDIIYELIDNLVIINNKTVLVASDKYSIFDNKSTINNSLIKKPLVVEITNKVYEKSNIELGKNDNINELIKAIYREIR